MIIILSVVDHKNIKVPDYLAPLYIGFGLCAILMSFGLNSDCALNPARDFSP
jgi:aquaporin-9